LTNSQSLNQYAYVGDNPTNVTDPSGMDVSFDFGGFGGGGGDCLWCEWGGSGGIPPISGGGLPGMGGGFPGLGGSGCDFIACGISGSGGGANGFTNVNGNIIGDENGEQGPCLWWGPVTGPCRDSFWNSITGKWQPDKPAPTPDQQKIGAVGNALAPLGK